MTPQPHFWARLTFTSAYAQEYVEKQDDLSGAPWRPGFFYVGESRNGYMIVPVAKEGDEFGMFALSPDFWENMHSHRIKPRVEFVLGSSLEHIQATGVVTRLA